MLCVCVGDVMDVVFSVGYVFILSWARVKRVRR